jgi:hypothetical protein
MTDPKKRPRRGRRQKNYMEKQEGIEVPASIVNDNSVSKNVEPVTERKYARQLQNWDNL